MHKNEAIPALWAAGLNLGLEHGFNLDSFAFQIKWNGIFASKLAFSGGDFTINLTFSDVDKIIVINRAVGSWLM